MKTRTTHKTEAIALRFLDYGESDRIVTFYTRDYGKISGIAKGARRSRKRFANSLEFFCCSQIVFSRRGRDSLVFLEESHVERYFEHIRTDLEKTLISSYMIELTDQFTLEDKKSASLFQLLYDFLEQVDAGVCNDALLRFFEIRLLKNAGYQPVLDRCTVCQRPLNAETVYHFQARAGGLCCEACQPLGEASMRVSPGTAKTLTMGCDMEPAKVNRLMMSELAARESRQLLIHFIRHLLGKELKSYQILNQIRKMGV